MKASFFELGPVLAVAATGCTFAYTPAGSMPEDPSRSSDVASQDLSEECGRYEASVCHAWAPKQRAFDAAFAEEIAAFHALEPELKAGGATAGVAAKAYDLRARFVKRCVAESGWSTVACWNGTFARDITEALAPMRLELGDETSAAVEAATLARYPDVRSILAKVEMAQGDVPSQQPQKLSEKLFSLTLSGNEDRSFAWSHEVKSITKTKDAAIFTLAPEGGLAMTQLDCHQELGHDSSGDLVINRPCVTAGTHVSKVVVLPPARVPLDEVGDFTLTKDTQASIVVSRKGNHDGHLLEAWIDLHTVSHGRKDLKYVRFRTTPMQDAKPGYP